MANRGGEGAASTVAQALQQAAAALQGGDGARAERICRDVLARSPGQFEALYFLGVAAGQAGRAREAAEWFAHAVRAQPRNPDAQYNYGVALGGLGRHEEALAAYARALEADPRRADAHYNRGVTLEALGRPDEALAAYAAATTHAPLHAQANHNAGVVLARMGRHAEALAAFDRALALRPAHAAAHLHRAIVLNDLDRAPEALLACDQAVALAPRLADAWYIRGNALRELERHADAVESFQRCLAIEPAHAQAHWNLADCLLLQGDFARGWEHYEWRWKGAVRGQSQRSLDRPLWTGGEPVTGRTLLLHAELGLGDTLQFSRYATEVARLGARVILEAQAPLVRLLHTLEGVAEVVARGEPLPPFDLHCPLMSLPLALRARLQSIPARVPYLRSEPELVAAWRERLGERRAPRVGLVWSGSRGLANDKRSMALAQALPLAIAGVEWVSLQKDVPAEDAALLEQNPHIRDASPHLADFAATAAAVELLDLVVTVDTSVAHVAGALAKPVWILLPRGSHDWRWLLEREDSLWYPTARLFRQSQAGDWAPVVERVRAALAGTLDV